MNELIKNIENWAKERNLINGSTPQKQFLKLTEEFGELVAGISKSNRELIIDSIGDCFVVTVIMCKQLKMVDYVILKACLDSQETSENNYFICLRMSSVLGDLSKLLIFKKCNFDNEYYRSIYEIVYFLSKIALGCDVDLMYCVDKAWHEIKNRKGRMVNGVFVKESDLDSGSVFIDDLAE